MIRTQIQLTEAQARALRRIADERGVSIAAVVRELVDDAFVSPGQARFARAISAVGRFGSGPNNVAREHDRELEQAYLA